MKVRLKKDVPLLIKGKEYNVESLSGDTGFFIWNENGELAYYNIYNFDIVPEIKETTKSGTQYICPMDLFGGAVIKGVRYKQCHNPSFYQPDLKTDATYNLPAEIVETWEKVQDDIFANGAKVAFDGNTAMIGGWWWSKETIETFRDIPRETYDKIIERLA